MLATGAEDGSLRHDVDPQDITVMLMGTLLATSGGDTLEQTGRLLDLVMDALRPRTTE
jgi:hypothetical protein